MHDPEITIVMPVRNEARAIEQTLDSVLAQDLEEPFEVVVADGRSTDGTRALLERRAAADPRVRIVDNPAGGTPHALNAALGAARGRFLVRIDGHSRVPPDYVRRLVDHLRGGECEGAGGQKLAVGRSAFGRAVAAAHASRFGIGDSKYHYATRAELVDHVPFGAYRTELARRIGGWDEELVRNQDYDFDYRYGQAGGRLLLDPSIVVEWRVRETPRALSRQYFQYGFWKLRTLLRHPSSLHLRWLAPPTLVVVLAGGALTSWSEPGRRLLAAAAGAYGAFLVVAAVSLGPRVGVRLVPHLALALATMQLSWGAGFAVSAGRAALSRVAGRRPARSRDAQPRSSR